MATVEFERVTKNFRGKTREVRAVDDLTLTIADGELVVLVGPSGCGKTTTLRLIAGLEEPTSGVIRIGEIDVSCVAPRDRDVAMVFQNYALYPHMTVFKNMAFGLKMRRVPEDEIKRRVGEVAGVLGIEDLLNRKPASLSGGERQRVALGRAVVRDPQVFLFDEPLSNLDAKLRTHMRTELKSLHRNLRATMIYVTHDQEEAMTLGDRIVVMKDGAIQQSGEPLEVYNRPANRFVAGFIGTPAMNFLEGSLVCNAGAVYFAGAIGRLRLPDCLAKGLDGRGEREVVLGIRPENIRLADPTRDADDQGSIRQEDGCVTVANLPVHAVEPLGDSSRIHLRTPAGESIVARVPPTVHLSPDQSVDASLNLSRAHLFDAGENGNRL